MSPFPIFGRQVKRENLPALKHRIHVYAAFWASELWAAV